MDVQELFGKFAGGGGARGARRANDFSTRVEKLKFSMMPKLRAEFFEMLGALIADGKPLDSAIRELEVRYTKKGRPLAGLLRIWLGSLDDGKPLAEALRGFASDTEVVIIAATEKSGDLANGFLQAAAVARAGAAIRGVLAAELTTPAIQFTALVVLLIGFATNMAPELVKTVPMAAMDDSQRMLFAFSAVVANTWMLALPVVLALFGVAFWSMPRYTGPARQILDKIPPWSVYRVYSGATFMISLAALIKAGVPIDSGIRFIRQQASPWMREHMALMSGRLRAGIEQGEALDTGLLSERMADMVAIYSKTSNFDAAVGTVGKMSMEDGLVNIKKKAGVARIASTLLIGVLVGWIFTAMMGISDAASRANTMTQQNAVKGARQ